MLLLVFLAQDTRRDVEVQETRERVGGSGGGGRVTAVRGEDRGPRPTLFSACTLILQHHKHSARPHPLPVGSIRVDSRPWHKIA